MIAACAALLPAPVLSRRHACGFLAAAQCSTAALGSRRARTPHSPTPSAAWPAGRRRHAKVTPASMHARCVAVWGHGRHARDFFAGHGASLHSLQTHASMYCVWLFLFPRARQRACPSLTPVCMPIFPSGTSVQTLERFESQLAEEGGGGACAYPSLSCRVPLHLFADACYGRPFPRDALTPGRTGCTLL